MTVLRWYRAEMNGTALGVLRWYRAEMNGTAAVGVMPLQPQTVEPGTTVTIQPQLVGGGFPDSWTWRQISGPTVTLVNTWANVAFVAPYPVPPANASVVIGVRATVGGTLSPEQTVTITVLPALQWARTTAGVWVGERWTQNPQITMPTVETVAGFTLDAYQNFNTPVAEGGFYPVTSGSDLGILHASSPAAIAGYATGPGALKVKADGAVGNGQTNSFYSAIRTTSVANGALRIRCHYEAGVGYGGAIKPIAPSMPSVFGQPTYHQQLYGLWRFRMRRLPSAGTGWGGVADLINSNTWPDGTGELGLDETNFDVGGNLGAFIRPSDHVANPNRAGTGYPFRRNASSFGGPSGFNDWHTWVCRAEPGRTRIWCDDYKLWDDTLTPIADWMSLVWQYAKPGTPADGTEGTVEIDWYTISRWVGP